MQVILKEGQLLEAGASLSRIVQMLSLRPIDFGMITSFRASEDIPLGRKQKMNDMLLKYIRGKLNNYTAYGAYRMVGHWKECSVTLPARDDNNNPVTIDQCDLYGGKIIATVEETWLILNDLRNPEFFDVLRTAAREFNQDAFIARIDGNFGLFSKGGDQWTTYGDVSEETLTSSFAELIGIQGYSELKKKRTHGQLYNLVFKENFEFAGIVIPNDNISSKMLFEAMNIIYKPCSTYDIVFNTLKG